jgi:hypothetical protein
MTDPVTAETFIGLPSFFWSGIVTAGATVLGALVGIIGTHWGTTKRLDRELEHHTAEKEKERLLAMRRDLYLKAVDANIRGLAYFGSLPQADVTKPDADLPIRNVFAAGAQLQLVVSQGTAQFVSDVVSAYGELQMKLLMRVVPMHNLRSAINTRTVQHDNAQAEMRRVRASMTQLHETGISDADQLARFQRSFELACQALEKTSEERDGFWKQQSALQRQYMKDMMPELRRLNELQTRLLVELRRELDIGGDSEFFQRIMQRQLERAEQAQKQFDRDFSRGTPSTALGPPTEATRRQSPPS